MSNNMTLSENTKIRMGLVVGLAGVIWWASSMSSKLNYVSHTLDNVQNLTAQATASQSELKTAAAVTGERVSARFDAIERRLLYVEALERRVVALENKFPLSRQ